MWQYFLLINNFQDTDYWSSSLMSKSEYHSISASPAEKKVAPNTDPNTDSNSSTANNSLNPLIQQQSVIQDDLVKKVKSKLIYRAKYQQRKNVQ